MKTEEEPSFKSRLKFGDIVKLPLIEGLDQMEPWIFVRINGDKVILRSPLVESPAGDKISTMKDPAPEGTAVQYAKVVSLKEFKKHNK